MQRDPAPWRGLSGVQELRLFAGFAVQPFFAAALGFLSFPLIDFSGRALYGGFPVNRVRAGISVALGLAFAAVVITVFVAVPAVMWCLRRGMLTLKQTLLSGMALGNIPFAIIVPLASFHGSQSNGAWFWPLGAIRALAIGSLFGLAGAAVFWAISIKGTPLGRSKGLGA